MLAGRKYTAGCTLSFTLSFTSNICCDKNGCEWKLVVTIFVAIFPRYNINPHYCGIIAFTFAGEVTEPPSTTRESEAVSLCFLQLFSWRVQDWWVVLPRGGDWSHQQYTCSMQGSSSDQLCGSGQHCISGRASECWCMSKSSLDRNCVLHVRIYI